MGRGGGGLLIYVFVRRGDLAGTWNGWVAGGGAPGTNENENENNEKHGIPDNPPQQRTQGKNTPFGNPLTPTIPKLAIESTEIDFASRFPPRQLEASWPLSFEAPRLRGF